MQTRPQFGGPRDQLWGHVHINVHVCTCTSGGGFLRPPPQTPQHETTEARRLPVAPAGQACSCSGRASLWPPPGDTTWASPACPHSCRAEVCQNTHVQSGRRRRRPHAPVRTASARALGSRKEGLEAAWGASRGGGLTVYLSCQDLVGFASGRLPEAATAPPCFLF